MQTFVFFLSWYVYRNGENDVQDIPSMPHVSRMGIAKLINHLKPLIEKGLSSVLLFGVIDSSLKVLSNI